MSVLSRTFRITALAVVAVLGLAGCASGATATSSTDADTELLPAAEGTTTYPLTLETAYGETILQERPERIAVVGGLGDQESVLALGITPVVGSDPVPYPWLEGTGFSDIPEFIDPWADSFDFETVLAAEPDLIVASTYGNLASDFERLSTIAPVLAVEPTGDYSWDWRELVTAVGEATDLSMDAAEQVVETEDAIVSAKAAHPEYSGRPPSNSLMVSGLRHIRMSPNSVPSSGAR
jgi:iron complex transport system substrate-binding protein